MMHGRCNTDTLFALEVHLFRLCSPLHDLSPHVLPNGASPGSSIAALVERTKPPWTAFRA